MKIEVETIEMKIEIPREKEQPKECRGASEMYTHAVLRAVQK